MGVLLRLVLLGPALAAGAGALLGRVVGGRYSALLALGVLSLWPFRVHHPVALDRAATPVDANPPEDLHLVPDAAFLAGTVCATLLLVSFVVASRRKPG